MADPDPIPTPATLTGWQYVVLQLGKAIVAGAIIVIPLFLQQRNQEGDRVVREDDHQKQRLKALGEIRDRLPHRVFVGE